MKKVELTGNWYIKKKLFGFNIMVEIEYELMDDCPYTFNWHNVKEYRRAKDSDLIELKINVL
jgi:hypothetical protein